MFWMKVVSVSRCSWTWWRTTRPVCGFWSWRRTTSVRSYSSRSVTYCLKERTTMTERPRPSSQAPPPAAPYCQSETSTSQSETSTSPPPGSPTAVRAELSLLSSPQTVPLYPPYWSPKDSKTGSNCTKAVQNQHRTSKLFQFIMLVLLALFIILASLAQEPILVLLVQFTFLVLLV